MNLSFDTDKEVKRFIKNNPSNLYTTKNVDGEKVLLYLHQGVGMDVKTYQKNGWIRVSEYGSDGILISQSYEGPYSKEEV